MPNPECTPTPMLCTSCGRRGRGVYRQPGRGGLEVALWLCGGVPGLIYSAWRRSPKRRQAVCKRCGLAMLVPLTSPEARRLLARQEGRASPKPASSQDPGVAVDWSPTLLPPVRPCVSDRVPVGRGAAVPSWKEMLAVEWTPSPLPPVRPYVPDSAPMPLEPAVPATSAREMGNPYRIF